MELDEVEAVYKLYPATIPFLNLLATLLHTPKRLSPRSLLADAEPLNTIPESLGQPYRLPGIGPYVSFHGG
jgi:nuclear pore complex protein Nup205